EGRALAAGRERVDHGGVPGEDRRRPDQGRVRAMFAITSESGMDMGGPDVCLPGPIPYPNMAERPMGTSVAYKVLLCSAPAHTLTTSVPISEGDNAGVAGGVVSHTDMGSSRRVTFCESVLWQNKPALRLGAVGPQNTLNCVGATIVPSQHKVLLLA